MIDQGAYALIARSAVDRLLTAERDAIERAGALVHAALRAGGVLQAFGTGHSRSVALELTGRAGGLVPANQLGIRDLAYYGDASPRDILDPKIEREPGLAARVWALADIRPEDIFVIISNSGGNAAIVEMARLAVRHGHQVIAITSRAHTAEVAVEERLADLAQVVIDNGAPYGDAAMPLPGGGTACGVSTLTGVLAAQLLVADVAGRFVAAGEPPPVFRSANTPGGDAHNDRLLERYGSRVRLGDA
ncbi:SIS domain-containing protein [Nonomuraea sp. 3-1Str]|uniref:SIS domain-containing protein n=1 Tax=Nonomuraea sp. 3-1Str TaxID=2929801 RepID=UPI002861EE3F|nr:SIS domain-containing protein [Nonomuraea sp. 3-1Str]MDR8414024.1 SIS domain-containing protein [Nonomuraea sp. 3-1Str]